MKKYNFLGFAVLVAMLADGSVTVTDAKGKTVKPKNGEYTLKCVSDEGNSEAWMPEIGTPYKFTAQALIDAGEGLWETEAKVEVVVEKVADVVELTTEQIAAAEIRKNIATAKETLKNADKAMREALPDLASGKLSQADFGALALGLKAANDAYEAIKGSGSVKKEKKEKAAKAAKVEIVKSVAEVDSENAILALKAIHEEHGVNLQKLIETHNATEGFTKFGKKVRKTSSGAKGGGGARIMDYAGAQAIRSEYSTMLKAGKTEAEAVKAIVESSGFNNTMITRIVLYRQHQLKTEDKAFLNTLPFPTKYHNKFAEDKMPAEWKLHNAWYSFKK